jgi:hypothetical protein
VPNTVIEPIFANEADRLTFLSRLWGVTITPQDVLDWEAYKLLRPTSKLPTETESEYSERFRVWNEGRYDPARQAQRIWAKWEGYRLGKVKAQAEAWLATRPNPNRNQARQAVLLQLQDKFSDRLALIDAAADLLPLVTGIVW